MGCMRRLGLASAALVLAACSGSPSDRPPRHEPGPGAGLSAQDAAAEVMDGLGTDAVVSVEADATPLPGNSNLPGLDVHVAGEQRDPAMRTRVGWLTSLCAGATSALMR